VVAQLLLPLSLLLQEAAAESAASNTAANPTAGLHSTAGEAWPASEPALLAHLAAGQQVDDVPLLRLCIARSWWRAARELTARAHRRSATIGDALDQPLVQEVTGLLVDLKHRADELAAFADQTYKDQTQGLAEVHCALQWAQNSTTVFLGVKYAARWSAPGAIEVADVKVNISSCCFELSGFGHHSSIRKHYTVNLGLFEGLEPSLSSWSASSVGRLTATLHKAKAKKWPRLMASKAKSSHQIAPWLDMEERWTGELEDFAREGTKKTSKGGKTMVTTTSAPVKKKGLRVFTPWRKAFLRQWRRLPKKLRRLLQSRVLCGGFIVGAISVPVAFFSRRDAAVSPAEGLPAAEKAELARKAAEARADAEPSAGEEFLQQAA